MKKLLLVLFVLAILPVKSFAFEFAVGPRYAGFGSIPNISPDSRLVQLEVLLGSFQFCFGAVQNKENAIPFTFGLINKFDLIPMAKPYLGGDFTYISLPSTMGYYAWTAGAKGGIEFEYMSFGFYGGLGYTFIYPGSLTAFTWEIGSRFYIIK
jgi:hypothetical protein